MTELQTTLGAEDLYDALEVVLVDAHNARVIRDKAVRDARNRTR